ncbi:MAG: galactose-1-phosphate uridylyltransferase [Massilia sp.]
MHILELTKPDGRQLTLYSAHPIAPDLCAPSPFRKPQGANPHLRWHALRGEWVSYAAYCQNRAYQPPPPYNPLAPSSEAMPATEIPAGAYEIAVFDNCYPALSLAASAAPTLCVPSAPATGHCEVVVFSQDPALALGQLPLSRIELLLEVWADRSRRIGALPDIAYVQPFENRGAEVGATLAHPHGQIHAYSIVPPVPARMLAQERAYFDEHGSALLCDIARDEAACAARVLYEGEYATAFVPACARYPYEAWIVPTAPAPDFASLTLPQREDLARALKTVLLKYDGLWDRPFPYLMCWYQAPADGRRHPETQLHAELLPPCRTRERRKVLGGAELGAGLFSMDVLPETTAFELQQVAVELEAA